MLRFLRWTLLILAIFLVCDQLGWAQSNSWPEFPVDEANPHKIARGTGSYFSWFKLVPILLIYFAWIRTSDWANRDCQINGLPYAMWNPIVTGPFLVGMIAVFTIPIFPLGFSLLLLSYLGPALAYVFVRNSKLDPHERVLTPEHIRHVMAGRLQQMGVEVSAEGKEAHEKGAPVVFYSAGGTDKQNQANIITARQSPGYLQAKDLVADLIKQRADKCMLDFSRDAVAVRYQIDGVWHEADGQDRETGDSVLAVFKTMANLNVEERRKRQAGKFTAELEKKKYAGAIISQGTQTGERVILQLDRPHSDFKTLRELGMREKMEEQIKGLLAQDHGLVLFSAQPAGGLTTTMRLALKLTDRFMRDFAALQDEAAPEPVADNIEITTYNTAKGELPQKILESLIRREPNAIVASDLPNAETAILLCDQAVRDKLIITTVRAKEAVEALLRVLLLKVPASKFAPAVIGVVNQRLIRKLCEDCKQGYEPAPQLLQKLGIPAGRVEQLYRPPEATEQEKVCPTCNGIGYFGRTSIYELVVVNAQLRQALEKEPKLDVLRKVSREAGNKNLQQEGLVLVAQGITSVQELSRVLKQ